MNLPKTIRDATVLVSNLGEPFPWIDTLCIIQDSDEDKAYQIRNLADIDSNSILTILAVEGSDACVGLSRGHGRYPETYLGQESSLRKKDAITPRSKTVWASRAWT